MNLNNAVENKLIKKSLKQNKLQLKALGSSMFPFIRNGDLVEIKSVEVENLSIGDIIFFEKEGKFFLHRLLIKKGIDEFITRGDNMPNFDKTITSKDILGKLTVIKRENHLIDVDSRFYEKLGKLIVKIHPLNYYATYFILNLFNSLKSNL